MSGLSEMLEIIEGLRREIKKRDAKIERLRNALYNVDEGCRYVSLYKGLDKIKPLLDS